jgi:uncharacterized protein involved in type VI secretion and phage assembly
MSNPRRPFLGKFRGRVTANQDPEFLGRIRAEVSDVFGDRECGWALPSFPFVGDGVGFFALPAKGSWVWIEFEHGDPLHPIWSGGFWLNGQQAQIPAQPALPEVKVIKTDTAKIELNDLPGVGGVTIETTDGMKIVINVMGITISNGAFSIQVGPTSVSINDGALEVT